MSANEDTDFTKFLFTFTRNILNSDRSIRRVGITDQNGNIINERYREGLSMDDKIFIFLNIIICYI